VTVDHTKNQSAWKKINSIYYIKVSDIPSGNKWIKQYPICEDIIFINTCEDITFENIFVPLVALKFVGA